VTNPFASKPAPTILTAAPEPKAPATMPDTESTEAIEARRRAQQRLAQRGGRASTILTAPDKRGGDNYSAPNLG